MTPGRAARPSCYITTFPVRCCLHLGWPRLGVVTSGVFTCPRCSQPCAARHHSPTLPRPTNPEPHPPFSLCLSPRCWTPAHRAAPRFLLPPKHYTPPRALHPSPAPSPKSHPCPPQYPWVSPSCQLPWGCTLQQQSASSASITFLSPITPPSPAFSLLPTPHSRTGSPLGSHSVQTPVSPACVRLQVPHRPAPHGTSCPRAPQTPPHPPHLHPSHLCAAPRHL